MVWKHASRALSRVDMSRYEVNTVWHQHGASVPNKKIFRRNMGSPVGGCLTVLFYSMVIALIISRIQQMETGKLDRLENIEQIGQKEIPNEDLVNPMKKFQGYI